MTRSILVTVALIAFAAPLVAQDPPDGHEVHSESGPQPAWTLGSGRTLWLFPVGDVYPPYIADLHRPQTAAMVQFYTRTGIDESTNVRAGLDMGGRFGLLRLDPGSPGGRSWQLSVDASYNAQFDSNEKLDSIGWDGKYGLTLTTANGGPLSFKVGVLHDSAHIGDEYAERTGRTRIDYTREELIFGFAVRPARGWRVYFDVGHGHYLLTEEQKPWRAQGGVEYTTRHSLFGGRFAWYAAVDFSGTEEREWRLDTTIQTGLTATSGGRRWRLGVQYADGRPNMGEFFQHTEAWFALGVWIDL